jgi:hypothetical protein
MSKLTQILKGEVATSRRGIEAAVVAKAESIARKKGISRDQAEREVWAKPGVTEAYERQPVGQPRKPEQRVVKTTEAEAELDRRARKRMKKSGVSYPKACSEELEADPGLYQRYEREVASGAVYNAPEPPEYKQPQFISGDHPMYKSAKRKDDPGTQDVDGDECPRCGGDVEDGDKYCANCGAKLNP